VSSKQSNFFSRFEPKQTETRSVSVVFRFVLQNQKTFFWFVLVCFGVSDWYRNNQNKQNFVETNQKNLQKTFSIRGSSKQLIFFSRFEPKQTETQSVAVVFRFVFLRNPKFFSVFGTGIETTETNRTYGMGN
jgi:hypothetical protein